MSFVFFTFRLFSIDAKRDVMIFCETRACVFLYGKKKVSVNHFSELGNNIITHRGA